MNFLKTASLLFVLAALQLASAATIQQPPPGFLERNPRTVIVKDTFFAVFAGEPGSAQAKQDHEVFRAEIKRLNIEIKERLQFTDLLNAISFEMDTTQLDKVATIKNVKDIFPMLSHIPPRVIKKDVSNPALKYAHGMTGVQEVHDALGFTGKGIKVGVIDTGIDFKHPALGGCYGQGCRVAHGYDFVGDAYDGKTPAVPGGEPRDHCNGHGTHVAGIIGARDKDFVGVAPDVSFGAYRVFGCKGSTGNDIIIAAMERAYKDGMNVINLSLGGGSSWAGYPDALLADRLADKGVVVVAAMGNDGDKGLFEASSPAMASKGFAVASYDNIRYLAYGFSVDGNKDMLVDYAASKDGDSLKFASTEIVSAKGDKDDLACAALPADSLKGKIALIHRGVCTFVEKAKNVQAAGAIAAVVYNKEFGAFTPSADDPALKIPVVGITQENGGKLLELMKKGKVTLTFGTEKQAFDNPTGGRVSGFSSWGPGPELEMKPDVGAPGGLIYSTYPLDMGSYATLSGTSMATPYTAGSVALFLQAKGKRNPVEIRDIFKLTANPTTELGTDKASSAFRQGGGIINVKNALTATTSVSPAQLPVLSTDIKSGKLKYITVKNTGKYPLEYEVSHQPSLNVKPWDKSGELSLTPELKEAAAKVDITTKTFRLEPGREQRVSVFFGIPSGLSDKDFWLFSGFIHIRPHYGYEQMLAGLVRQPAALSVPYGGMLGNYKSINVMTPPESGLPTVFNGHTGAAATESTVFTMKGDDTPTVVVRLLHPCKHLIVSVLDAKANKVLGTVSGGDNKFLGRNDQSPENLSVNLAWDGSYVVKGAKGDESKDVTNGGSYKIRVAALRPFGQESRSADWQTWDSPAVIVDRTKEPSKVPAAAATGNDAAIAGYVRQKIGVSRSGGVEQDLRDKLDSSVLIKPFKIVEVKA